MGIVNVTPDSFSDGGQYSRDLDSVLSHTQQLLDEGVRTFWMWVESLPVPVVIMWLA